VKAKPSTHHRPTPATGQVSSSPSLVGSSTRVGGGPEPGATVLPHPQLQVQPYRATGSLVLSAHQVHKTYHIGGQSIPVLSGVSLAVRQGQFTTIVGQSGSGKSTLLHLLGTLDRPDRGEICLHKQRIDNLPFRQRDVLRNREIGLIFQFYHLLPELTVLENTLVPFMIRYGVWQYWLRRRQHAEDARELLRRVGLGHRLNHRPNQLSGGERQRTAIARALVTQPKLLLADEPTGNLDAKTGAEVLDLLRQLSEQQQLTVVMVTHDEKIAEQSDQIIRLRDGKVVSTTADAA
jgi:lipoprotein-releasing system ATP-binding protein